MEKAKLTRETVAVAVVESRGKIELFLFLPAFTGSRDRCCGKLGFLIVRDRQISVSRMDV